MMSTTQAMRFHTDSVRTVTRSRRPSNQSLKAPATWPRMSPGATESSSGRNLIPWKRVSSQTERKPRMVAPQKLNPPSQRASARIGLPSGPK